jgi:hypothetical protein
MKTKRKTEMRGTSLKVRTGNLRSALAGTIAAMHVPIKIAGKSPALTTT